MTFFLQDAQLQAYNAHWKNKKQKKTKTKNPHKKPNKTNKKVH